MSFRAAEHTAVQPLQCGDRGGVLHDKELYGLAAHAARRVKPGTQDLLQRLLRHLLRAIGPAAPAGLETVQNFVHKKNSFQIIYTIL